MYSIVDMGAMRKVGMSRCVRIRIAVLYIDRQPSDVQRREMRCSPTDLLFRPDRLQYGRIANRTNPFKLFFLLVIILLLFFLSESPHCARNSARRDQQLLEQKREEGGGGRRIRFIPCSESQRREQLVGSIVVAPPPFYSFGQPARPMARAPHPGSRPTHGGWPLSPSPLQPGQNGVQLACEGPVAVELSPLTNLIQKYPTNFFKVFFHHIDLVLHFSENKILRISSTRR